MKNSAQLRTEQYRNDYLEIPMLVQYSFGRSRAAFLFIMLGFFIFKNTPTLEKSLLFWESTKNADLFSIVQRTRER